MRMNRPPPNDQFSHGVSTKQTMTFSEFRPGVFATPATGSSPDADVAPSTAL